MGASAAVLFLGALWWAREVVIPLVLAVLVSFVLAPAVNALQRLGVGRVPSVCLIVLLALFVVAALGVVLFDQGVRLAADLPQYQDRIVNKISQFREATHAPWLEDLGRAADNVTQQIQNGGKSAVPDPKEPLVVEVRPPVYPLLQTAASSVLGFLLQSGLVLILVIFILSQREDLRNRLIRLLGHGNITGMTKALDDMGQRLSRFLLMQMLINLAFGAAVGGGIALIGWMLTGEPFPYAIVAGLLAAVLRYLPYLGAWISMIFPALVALAVYPQWAPLLWILGLIAALELTIGNFLEPMLYGHSIGVSEVALLVAAAFWVWLWGPIGLILAPPMTVCFAVAGRFIPQLEFLDILLSNKPALPTHLTFFQRLLARDQDEASELVEDYVKAHPERDVCDDVLAPALLLTERNLRHGQLTAEEAQSVYQATREIVDELELADRPASAKVPELVLPPPTLVFGMPARDDADALILKMLVRKLPPQKCVFRPFSPKTLASEFLEEVRQQKPAIVCLGVLPVNRLAHARYLCYRLRAQFSTLKILVVCVGLEAQRDPVRDRLKAAGADEVVETLAQASNWLMPRLTLAPLPSETQQHDSAA